MCTFYNPPEIDNRNRRQVIAHMAHITMTYLLVLVLAYNIIVFEILFNFLAKKSVSIEQNVRRPLYNIPPSDAYYRT